MINFPKQHGAWAMVILPGLISFFAVWRFNWLAVLLFFAAFLVFIAHYNFSENIKNLRRKKSLNFSQLGLGFGLTIFGICIGIFVMLEKLPTLWIFGVIATVLFVLHFVLIYIRKEMTVFGEMVGVAGLTLTSPMLVYALQNACDERLYGLWFLNIAYFSGTIFFVKLKIRIQPNVKNALTNSQKIKIGQQTIIHLIMTIGFVIWMNWTGILPKIAFITILPMIWKTIVGILKITDKKSLDIRKLGFSELRHAIGFSILVILSFHVL